jgi:AcrR family transcriptional regulator
VIKVEDRAEIRGLRRAEGLSISEIARRMGLARNMVSSALASERPPKYERCAAPGDWMSYFSDLARRRPPTPDGAPAFQGADRGWRGGLTAMAGSVSGPTARRRPRSSALPVCSAARQRIVVGEVNDVDAGAEENPPEPGQLGGSERVGRAAYELFTRHGVRDVGVDAVVARAGTAKMTLYRNFPSKNDLILDFLSRRERCWTEQWLIHESRQRGCTPEEQLLSIFDLFSEWFARPDFEGCVFLTTMMEINDPADTVFRAAVEHLGRIRGYLREQAAAACVDDPTLVARQWHILMKGSIIAAQEGDRDAARAAKEMGGLLLRAHEPG